MKTRSVRAFLRSPGFAVAAMFLAAGTSSGESVSPLVDDFSDAQNNSLGIQRQFVDDRSTGGSTTTDTSVSEGVLAVRGEISPPRGQPGWSSTVQLLDPQGQPRDLSEFEGVRLRLKITAGMISVSANSAEVTNFDYHAARVVAESDDEFHEVRIPFKSMQRAWSEQTPLNTSSISSLSIVAFGVQKGTYEFELDEIGFY
jgi:hypothetical protein